MVDICTCWFAHHWHSVVNSRLSKHKSGDGKPGKEFENGIGCLMSDLKIKSDITNHQIRNFLNQPVAHTHLNSQLKISNQ